MSKILICHPDAKIRETLKLILCDHYNLILTDNISQCLYCLEHAQDIKILLADMNNLEAAKGLKKGRSKFKTIVASGYKGISETKENFRQDIAGYVIKPFKADEVLSTVSALLL